MRARRHFVLDIIQKINKWFPPTREAEMSKANKDASDSKVIVRMLEEVLKSCLIKVVIFVLINKPRFHIHELKSIEIQHHFVGINET